MNNKTLAIALIVSIGTVGSVGVRAAAATDPIGLSLFFQNGQMSPITIVGDAPRYLQEIDITATLTTQTDEGIEPIIHNGDLSSLDWSGVTMVEEDWRHALDGTWTRQRFYRDAKWMERPSKFLVFPMDRNGNEIGEPLIAQAGSDDRWGQSDDGFVRRFVARQIATGCPSKGNCNGATFTAQGLVQLRDALHADKRDRIIPAETTSLALKWTEDKQPRTVGIIHASPSDFPYGYGFQVSLEQISTPANGQYYIPGEQVSFRITLKDGQGNRLHQPGSLPTYGQFVRGEIKSGIRYYDPLLFETLYYALKHRESNILISLEGPTDKLRTPNSTVGADQFLLPVLNFATTDIDGYSDIATGVPQFPIILGGFSNPAIWDTPVSDTVTFTIPSDALPGTYIAATKARREFGGEALNRATTTEIQVGTSDKTTFTAKTGNCGTCHNGPSSFGNILHGLTDRRACYSCHGTLAVEPDTALDIRVHEVHDRSDRFSSVGDITNCDLCHLTPLDELGPARGLLGN